MRNIAIIAHVDHGKTTLIDVMLRQSGMFRDNQEVAERVMDSNDLEKERGITILAKCTSLEWQGETINIIDTPGHADFGGEVERVLSMADGVILLVDAAEGPMPQTKFVLSKALRIGLRPIVVINKIDRQDARPEEVIDEVFDLFVALDATDKQLDFPILYASGRNGWCVRELSEPRDSLTSLFETIVSYVPEPAGDKNAPFAMLVTMLDADPYLGRVLIGRVVNGTASVNSAVKSLNLKGEAVEQARLTKLMGFRGIKRVPVDKVQAGDIICVAGLTNTSVSDTIGAPELQAPLASTPIDPPTMAITITVNDSPYAGQEGTKVTSRMILDRLEKEAESNVAITLKLSNSGDAFEVGGRGELQLGVLIETMRREGFELSVSRPKVLYKRNEQEQVLEPIEEATIDVDEEYSGIVVEKLNKRKGLMQDMRPSGIGKTRMIFHIPSRGLIGYQSEFLTDTRGTGILNRIFHCYEPYKGEIQAYRNGVLISNALGDAVAYAMNMLQDRGDMFINPGDKVYEGMIVGEHNRDNDLEVNILRAKQLTNIRAAGKDDAIRLTPPRKLTLEDMIAYIHDDELVEVTPKSLRLRKKFLDANDRKRESRKKEKDVDAA